MLIGLIGGGLFIFFIYGVFPASENFENGLFDSEIINPLRCHLGANVCVDDIFYCCHARPSQILTPTRFRVPTIAPRRMLLRVIEALKNTYFRVLFIATLVARRY